MDRRIARDMFENFDENRITTGLGGSRLTPPFPFAVAFRTLLIIPLGTVNRCSVNALTAIALGQAGASGPARFRCFDRTADFRRVTLDTLKGKRCFRAGAELDEA